MKIVRTMPDEGWVPIANSAARDHRLSWRARGLLLELLSYPPGWETTVRALVDLGRNARKEGGHAEGRDAMYAAMEELHTFGYVAYHRERGDDGHFGTSIEVSDAPIRLPEKPESVNQESVGTESADQEPEDQVGIKNTDTNTDRKTDLELSGFTEHSTSLDTLAAAADAATDVDLQERLLDKIYSVIDGLTAQQWHQHLLIVEKKRPRIYREARNEAIKQVKRDEPKTLTSDRAAKVIDRLSYKWIAVHYIRETGELPIWFARPMGWVG